MTNGHKAKRPLVLGIQSGGTRTVALMADVDGQSILRREFGPGNLRLLDELQLKRLGQSIAKAFPKPDALGFGVAGARTKTDRERVIRMANKIWRGVPIHVTNDLDVAVVAAVNPRKQSQNKTTVLVLSGTGSCCYGRTLNGRTAKLGGWGHILGDKGSGFEIALRGLKAVVFYYDRDDTWSRLGERFLAATGCNEPNELIDWIASADKAAVAAIAIEVFAARKERDRIAKDILKGATSSLAKDAVNCARKLLNKGEPVDFVLAGSVLLKQPLFAREVSKAIRGLWPNAKVRKLEHEGAWGAVKLAVDLAKPVKGTVNLPKKQRPLPSTERRNPRSMKLDRMSIVDAVELMLIEEERGVKAVRAETKRIARVTGWVANTFRDGGRLFYVGAGTSGRLGILDASECPPTFQAERTQVQGIIAGGTQAITNAVEGAEDDKEAGARTIRFRGIKNNDVVIGVAASGQTPFVWGALERAKAQGAKTALICFDPNLKKRRGVPDLLIAPATGPEVLTGSTRLKAGTATKLILNCITTLAFARIGKIAGNLMIDLDPKNEKLRDRAVRITSELSEVDPETTRSVLEKEGWNIKKALCRLSI